MFELHKLGIMDVVHAALLEAHNINRPVLAKLYKLNVYGECGLNNMFFDHMCTLPDCNIGCV